MQVHVSTCHVTAAMQDFQAEHADDLPPGTILSATVLPEGEKPRDPLAFDADRAKAEYEAHLAKFGLT